MNLKFIFTSMLSTELIFSCRCLRIIIMHGAWLISDVSQGYVCSQTTVPVKNWVYCMHAFILPSTLASFKIFPRLDVVYVISYFSSTEVNGTPYCILIWNLFVIAARWYTSICWIRYLTILFHKDGPIDRMIENMPRHHVTHSSLSSCSSWLLCLHFWSYIFSHIIIF